MSEAVKTGKKYNLVFEGTSQDVVTGVNTSVVITGTATLSEKESTVQPPEPEPKK